MPKPIEQQIVARIYGHGRGWAFSPKDFLDIGSRQAVDLTLYRLNNKGTTRRAIRGIYDYPRFSTLLNQQLGPDIHQVAMALARKFGWDIQPGPAAALNIIGLSTQVSSRYIYLSNGPDRSYKIVNTDLEFEHTALKEVGFRYDETATIVQAIKALTPGRITPETGKRIRDWLPQSMAEKVLKDSERITDWVYAEIKQILKKEGHNG